MPPPHRPTLLVIASDAVRHVVVPAANRDHDVELAIDLGDARQRLTTRRYDTVCAEVRTRGRPVLSLLGDLGRARFVPVRIVVSASDDPALVSRVWRVGVEEVLHEPVDATAIREGLRRAVTRRDRRASVASPVLPPALERYARVMGDAEATEIVARRYEGQSITSIASALGISVVAAKKRLRRIFFRPLGTDRLLELDRRARRWLVQHELG